jgi:hypothetical protein
MALTAEETRIRLRAGAAAVRKRAAARPPWQPPAVTGFLPERRILAFDASLVNTGWVVIVVKDGRVFVEGHGTIHPGDNGQVGYMATWQRARSLKAALWDAGLVVRYMRDPETLKAVEAPPAGGGLHRVESSLIAGMTCWLECGTDCAVVSATHVSAVLLGDHQISSRERKPAVKAAVLRYVPEAKGRGWDEHQRDALSVGLTRLFDLEEGREHE